MHTGLDFLSAFIFDYVWVCNYMSLTSQMSFSCSVDNIIFILQVTQWFSVSVKPPYLYVNLRFANAELLIGQHSVLTSLIFNHHSQVDQVLPNQWIERLIRNLLWYLQGCGLEHGTVWHRVIKQDTYCTMPYKMYTSWSHGYRYIAAITEIVWTHIFLSLQYNTPCNENHDHTLYKGVSGRTYPS